MVYAIVGVFIVLDFVSGLIKAFKEKNYNSTIMREGLFHKCGSVLCITFGVLVDFTQGFLDIGITVPVASAICTYIVLMECGSIIENIGAINPEIVPNKLKSYFSKINDK